MERDVQGQAAQHPIKAVAHLPVLAAIEAYGNGGFRFGGMSHRGSLLCLPSGVYAWSVDAPQQMDLLSFAPVLDERAGISFLLLGTGSSVRLPGRAVRQAFMDAGLGLEVMDTGAACRTFSVLLAEGRPVAAALIAVP